MRYLLVSAAVLSIFTAGQVFAAKPLTFEEAQALALQKVPGVVVDTERSIHNGAVVFEFDIRQENGTVMDIEIDSVTHEVLELKVDKVGMGGVLPEAAIDEDRAKDIAVKYVQDNTSGLRGVDVHDIQYTIADKRVVYIVKLQRGISHHIATVDAQTGKVLSFKDGK